MPSQEAMRAPSNDPQAPVPPHEMICAPSVESPDDLPSEKIDGVDTPILSIFDVSSDNTGSSCLSMVRADSLDEQLGGGKSNSFARRDCLNTPVPLNGSSESAYSSGHEDNGYDSYIGTEEDGGNFGYDYEEDQSDAASNAAELPNDDGEDTDVSVERQIANLAAENPDADPEWLEMLLLHNEYAQADGQRKR